MRPLLLAITLMLPLAARAEIDSADACASAVVADPAAAREDAAVWARSGGGVPARLCEAEALAALGAHGNAALLLTRLAENPNRSMDAGLRATVLADAAGQWLAAGRTDLAAAALDRADAATAPDPARLLLRSRVQAGDSDWTAARATLDAAVAADPDDALARAFLAATLRHLGDPDAARTQADRALALAPDLPEAMFEAAAAAAATGDADRAGRLWQQLIAHDPDTPLADVARGNLQRLE